MSISLPPTCTGERVQVNLFTWQQAWAGLTDPAGLTLLP